MKRLLLGLAIVMGTWILSPTSDVDANGWQPLHGEGCRAPELDLNAAGTAMVLLLGGAAYIASRRREEGLE